MKTTHKVIFTIAVLGALVVAYCVGHLRGFFVASDSQMYREFEHWASLADLDRSFLTNVTARPSALTTGTYVLETRFPGKPPMIDLLALTFTNGQFALPKPVKVQRNGMAETLIQNGNVVSWHYEGIMYMANAEYVGLIDGDTAWGRVYGWGSGDESIGNWRLYRQAATAGTNSTVAPTRAPDGAGVSPHKDAIENRDKIKQQQL